MTLRELLLKIDEIRPGAQWNLRGMSYDGLEWLDIIQTKPTAEELGLEV